MATNVFVSYDFDNDKHYKRLLQAWSKNDQFDFDFYDQSVDVSVDSTSAGPIRRTISGRIRKSDVLLCIIGKKTHRSSWVNWEIKKAIELNKDLVAVKLKSSYTSPSAILGEGAKWAHSFNFDAVKKAVEEARFGFSFGSLMVGLVGFLLLKALLQ